MNSNHHARFSSGGRYPILRSVAILYLILGIVSVIAGICSVFWMLVAAPFAPADRVVLAGATLVGAVFWCGLMFAASEIIKLFIDIEHNSRTMSIYRPMTPADAEMSNSDLSVDRFSVLNDETAEAALIRGH